MWVTAADQSSLAGCADVLWRRISPDCDARRASRTGFCLPVASWHVRQACSQPVSTVYRLGYALGVLGTGCSGFMMAVESLGIVRPCCKRAAAAWSTPAQCLHEYSVNDEQVAHAIMLCFTPAAGGGP